ncbi:MAG: hypothetical protein ACRDXX_05930 [Stackebrandtia sp.]
MSGAVYQCFYWHGGYATLRDTTARRDPGESIPPLEPRGWLFKPDTLRWAAYADEDTALAWLWEQMRHLAGYVRRHQPHRVVDVEADFRAARRDLAHGDMACQWDIRLPDGTYAIAAVVAVYQADDDSPESSSIALVTWRKP